MEDTAQDVVNENPVERAAPAASDQLDVPEERKALVKEWIEKVKDSRDHWNRLGVFREMKENQQFARRGADKSWVDDGNYVVPILNRHINQSVAALYAKNPTVVAKRRNRVMYKLWDGRSDTLQGALEAVATAGDPNAAAIVQEVLAVRQENLLMDRMGKTLEVLWDYFVKEQAFNFKQQLKAAVRRAKVCKVAYIKLGFQRILESNPDTSAEIEDVTSKIAAMEATMYRLSQDDLEEDSARLEELKQNLEDLQSQEAMLVREGPIFDFPKSDSVVIDKKCRHLKSLAGADFIAYQYDLTPDKVLEFYGKDLGNNYTKYDPDGKKYDDDPKKQCMARVYEVEHKRDRQCFTVCEGYPDYLKEPYGSKLKIERFFTLFPIVFNECEDDENIYPPSDVEQGKHIQNEYNRSREALRQHRIASRPYYLVAASVEDADKDKLSNHADHEIITVAAMEVGQKAEDFIQRGPTAPIDPNLYEVEMHFTDMLRALGTQEANLGGTSDSTATESSIAEQSLSVSNASSVDDLDEVLSELAKSTSQLMLTELDKETVVEIAGPGAVWPDMPETREQVAKDLFLDIQAGSSGRPNQAAELAKFERGAPILVQIPGLNPKPLARRLGELLDLDVEELIAEDLPSITAMNAMMAKIGTGQTTGNPETDPNMQGSEGGNNAQGPQQNENEPGSQPAYPAPGDVSV